MATWRSAEPSSAGCLDLAECVRTNRKTLAPNQKQLSAEVRRRAVVSEVGATRRLFNFLSPVSGVGKPGCGGSLVTENLSEIEVTKGFPSGTAPVSVSPEVEIAGCSLGNRIGVLIEQPDLWRNAGRIVQPASGSIERSA